MAEFDFASTGQSPTPHIFPLTKNPLQVCFRLINRILHNFSLCTPHAVYQARLEIL
jgi:hypothetical protein